jgi:hypothetical protein
MNKKEKELIKMLVDTHKDLIVINKSMLNISKNIRKALKR